jgi:hypothetical protein
VAALQCRQMSHAAALSAILSADPVRRHVFGLVYSLGLPDCWIGAGFVRNAVWDHLHGRSASRLAGDVDIIWFHPTRAASSDDQKIEAALRTSEPLINWSVKNQARMHFRNGDAPYVSTVDAMHGWPETATAVAARQTDGGAYEIAAPFGLDDLFTLTLRPTPRFRGEKHGVYLDRVRKKGWLKMWPRLRMTEHN